MKFDDIISKLVAEDSPLNDKVQITLNLNPNAVKHIEQLAEEKIQVLLEREINENTEAFVEMMGYDNW